MSGQTKLTYHDKPVFGLDIGRSTLKIMQVEPGVKMPVVCAYGSAQFDPAAIVDGVIVDPETVIKTIHSLCTNSIVGELATKRVAMSIPNEYSFSRVLSLPALSNEDMKSAVMSEAERSIPLKLDDLYYDYRALELDASGNREVQLVATPKKIVDSYILVIEALGLELAAIETNIGAVTRMVTQSEGDDVVSLIVDLGSTAADLSIYDGNSVRITATADCGSEDITELIARALSVTSNQAHTIKTRYGLEPSKKQQEILKAIAPELDKLVAEIKKIIRYYSDRSDVSAQVGQIIVLGGGANLPGLSTYLTDQIRIPTRLCDPWQNLSFGTLQPPHQVETTLYTTAGGLSLVSAEELSA
jgi:type IV pilus assembly protein PilM